MKRYISGVLTGALITTMVITFIGATQAKDDGRARYLCARSTW